MPSAKHLHLKFTSLKYMSSAKCVYVTVKGHCKHLNGDWMKLTDLPIQNLLFNLVDMLVFAHAFPLACSHWWPVRCIVWGWGDGLEAWTWRCWTLFPDIGMVSVSIFPRFHKTNPILDKAKTPLTSPKYPSMLLWILGSRFKEAWASQWNLQWWKPRIYELLEVKLLSNYRLW